MTIKERVNKVFKDFSVDLTAEQTKLQAELVLENGTTIFTDAEEFVEGDEVFIINDEGEKIPLPQGDYTLQDGGSISVAEGGKVASVNRGGNKEGKEGVAKGNPNKTENPVSDAKSGDAAAPPTPPKKGQTPPKTKKSADENLAEEVEEVEAMENPLTEVAVVALINKILDERFPIKAEEEEEEEKEEKEEMSSQVLSLEEKIKTLESELFNLKKEAASEGLKRAKSTPVKNEVVDLTSLSTEERIKALSKIYTA